MEHPSSFDDGDTALIEQQIGDRPSIGVGGRMATQGKPTCTFDKVHSAGLQSLRFGSQGCGARIVTRWAT